MGIDNGFDNKSPVFYGEGRSTPPINLKQLLQERISTNPGTSTEQLLTLTDDQFRQLTTEDYVEYFYLARQTEEPTRLLAPHAQVIADRFEKDISSTRDNNPYLAHDVGEQTRHALWMMTHDDNVHIAPAILNQLYGYTKNDHRMVRQQAIEYIDSLMYLDNRNRRNGEQFLDIFSRYRQDTISRLTNPKDTQDFEAGRWMIDVAWASFPGELPEMLAAAIQQSPTPETLRHVYPAFVNRIGLEEARKFLRAYAQKHPDFEPVLNQAERNLGFDTNKPQTDLRKLYEDILPEFLQYKPNEELITFETSLLKRAFKSGLRILDVGHGPAVRHMNALNNSGLSVIGFDFVNAHAQAAKKGNPELQVTVADWHHMPFADGSVDGVYCLGGSIHHNTTVDDWLDTLGEMRRVLGKNTSQIRKKAIIDTRMLGHGKYITDQQRFNEVTDDLGIYHRETGDIHDSPDDQHAFDRLLPTEKQFRAMAKLRGFNARIVAKKTYGDEAHGGLNTNVYWELTVSDKPLSSDKLFEYMADARTGHPALEITWV